MPSVLLRATAAFSSRQYSAYFYKSQIQIRGSVRKFTVLSPEYRNELKPSRDESRTLASGVIVDLIT